VDHLAHFGLSEDAFTNDPVTACWFASAEHEDAERRLLRGVRQSKGLTLLLGESGTGKTLLLRRVLDALPEERFEAGVLTMIASDPGAGWLLGRLARQIGVEDPSADRMALRSQIYARLVELREEGRHTVVMIDGAQGIAHDEDLAELRGLLLLEHDERRLLSILLAGPSGLDAVVARDAALAERIEMRIVLPSLSEASARAYVAHRLGAAGGSPALFDEVALGALARLSGGIPRRLNSLADNALYEAFAGARARADAEDVQRAARDLGLVTEEDAGVAMTAAAAPVAMGAPFVAPSSTPEPIGLPDMFEQEALVQGEITDPEIAPLFEDSGSGLAPVGLDGPPKDEEIEDLFDGLIGKNR
jgi:type II secretory pathway predicted ATPase ExeA